MEFPQTLEKHAIYKCGHTLHLTETVHNASEEECFVCGMYESRLCPECHAAKAIEYRDVYDVVQNSRYDGYTILFNRRYARPSGSMLFEERLWNDENCVRSTLFLVEHDINFHEHIPIGIYRGEHFVPFRGFTAEYMQLLLRHDREAIQAETALEAERSKTEDWWGL